MIENPYWKENHLQNVLKVLGMILVLSMCTVQAYPAFAIDALDRINVENPRLLNSFTEKIGTKINVNQQVQITSDIRNNQSENQQFTYIVQVKNANQEIVLLAWLGGHLQANQSFTPSISWTPQLIGEYNVEIFVWDGFTNQSPLTESRHISVTVS